MGLFQISLCFLSVYCILLSSTSVSADPVPVYMWETADANEVVPAVPVVSSRTFEELLLQKIKETDPYILVMVEETLSSEDYRSADKNFKYISDVGSRSHVTFIPLVDDPIGAIKRLPGKKTEASVNEIINSIPKTRITIVNLNDAKDGENRLNMLARHDAAAVRIYDNFVEQGKPVLAIYTAHSSSWVIPKVALQGGTRKLLAAEDEPNSGSYALDSKFIVYLSGAASFTKDGKVETFTLKNETTIEGDKITVKTNGSDLEFTFTNITSYWYITNITYNGVSFQTKIYSKFTFSYHCTAESHTDGTSKLSLPGFQIQISRDDDIVRFASAYDCVGFTTIPIWSGLFVSFILIMILTMGLTMMMDIKTMDRFDDPKGKTIIVNVGE